MPMRAPHGVQDPNQARVLALTMFMLPFGLLLAGGGGYLIYMKVG